MLDESEGEVILRFRLLTGCPPSVGCPPVPRTPEGLPAAIYRGPGAASPTERDVQWTAVSGSPAEYSVLVRVPDGGRIKSEVRSATVDPPSSGPPGASHNTRERGPEVYVRISEPAVLRDLRVVRVTFAPFACPANGTALALEVRLVAMDGPGVNERARRPARTSAAFERLYESRVINYRPRDGRTWPLTGRPSPGGGPFGARRRAGAEYLVITHDGLVDGIADLIEWKEAKGLHCRVATLSEIGATPAEIRTFVHDAFHSWDVQPEYVLLVGDHTLLPAYNDGETFTDNYYAAVAGEDYLADVMVGRFPAESVFECQLMSAKVVAYESGGGGETDTGWPTSAALLIAEDVSGGNWVYHDNTRFIRELMEEAEFSPIDTLFTRNDVTSAEVLESVNAGVGFVNYRGGAWCTWPRPFSIDPFELENAWKLPVVISATCGTVSLEYDVCYSHTMLRAGSLDEPTGAVAFFGTTTVDSGIELSLRRGYVDTGFFDHAFGWGRTLGEACVAGKLNMYLLAEDRVEYEGWTLMGDPELNLWTGERVVLDVAFDPIIRVGPTDFSVTVTGEGDPIVDARVECRKDADVETWQLTGDGGVAVIPFETTSPGTLAVLVTARNAVPYHGHALVLWSGPFVTPDTLALDDAPGGNGDGHASPGEVVSLDARLANLGDRPADGVVAVLRSRSEHACAVDSVAAYGDLEPGATSWGAQSYSVSISPGHPRHEPLMLDLVIGYGESLRTAALPAIGLAAGDLEMTRVVLDDSVPCGDGDGVADAGETIGVVVFAVNEGLCGISSIAGTITSDDPHVAVVSGSATFTGAPPGSLASNGVAPFLLSLDPAVSSGHEAALTIAVEAAGNSYTYAETLEVIVTVGEASSVSPTGPDWYGYYAYDSTDTLYGEAPEYDWVDIAPPGPGYILDGISEYDDRVQILSLPFIFPYYGENQYMITACTNGFLTVDMTNYNGGDNSSIPNHHGPPGMIAPLWDDLSPLEGGDVYFWWDGEGHRYIIQYERVRHAGSEATETFQVLFLDPQHYPTPTGDGIIVFQYEDVSEPDSCTVGIENVDQNDGLLYLFDGAYAVNASALRDSLAIRFTTEPPAGASLPWLVVSALNVIDGTGDGDGVPEAGETIDIVLCVSNAGGAPANDLELALMCGDTAVVVLDGASLFPDIPPDGSATNEDDPFTVTLGEQMADSLVALRFEVGGSAGPWSSALRYDLRVFSPDEPEVTALRLAPCHPNPFAGRTVFRLEFPQPGHVTLRVYDVAGRHVKTLVDDLLTEPRCNFEWDGTNAAGLGVASGVYFVRMTSGGEARTRKAVLLR